MFRLRDNMPALALIVLSCLLGLVLAGDLNFGDPCSQENSRLQLGTYQFWDECNSKTYCASNSTCAHKGCRNDDFPFGYDAGVEPPPKCGRGFFCPDEQDSCLPVQPVGSPCQLNRDDQCEGPPNWRELIDRSDLGLNVNGSVCLNGTCMWANVTEGESCFVENTAYIAYGSKQEFVDIVSRGNCRLGMYCDSQDLKCVMSNNLGASCASDKECSSYNCLGSGVCGESPKNPRHFGAWVYVLVCLGILIALTRKMSLKGSKGMFGTLFGLFWLHRSQRDLEREKRLQYWREQNAFHQSVTHMRETARHSIMSLGTAGGNSVRSSMITSQVESSNPNILQHPIPKSSSLRQVSDLLKKENINEEERREDVT